MRHRIANLLVALALAVPATSRAGTILTWHEEGVRDGKAWTSESTAYVSELGIRVDVDEKTEKESHLSFVYVKRDATVYFVPEPGQRLAINADFLEALRAKVRQAGKSDAIRPPKVRPMHTRHSVNGFACEGYSFRHPGHPTRFVCLADPAAIGVDAATREHFSALGKLLTPFLIYAKRLSGDSKASETEAVDTYSLPGGFPVREWEPGKDAMTSDFQLVSVRQGETPASLFAPPGD